MLIRGNGVTLRTQKVIQGGDNLLTEVLQKLQKMYSDPPGGPADYRN